MPMPDTQRFCLKARCCVLLKEDEMTGENLELWGTVDVKNENAPDMLSA